MGRLTLVSCRCEQVGHLDRLGASRRENLLGAEPVVVLDKVTIRYGDVHAVNGLNLNVSAGEVVGMLGGNGAGKSSTLRAVAGVNRHTGGTLLVNGHNMADPTQVDAGRSLVGYCPDVGGLIPQATPREHLGLALALRDGLDLWPHALHLLHEFGLHDVLDRPTSGFSHGMSRRLSVLLAGIAAQAVLVLDEPFDGVDPVGVDATMRLIRRATDDGLGVIVSTHLLALLTQAADRLVVMVRGHQVDAAPAHEFAGPEGAARYAQLLHDAATGKDKTYPTDNLHNPDDPDDPDTPGTPGPDQTKQVTTA